MKQLTLLDVIYGKYTLNDKQKDSMYELLSKGCRQSTKNIIWRRITDHLSLLPHYGILGRVMIEGDEVSYCAGQSYPDELRTVRKIFVNMR